MMSSGFHGQPRVFNRQRSVQIVEVLALLILCVLSGRRVDGQVNAPTVLQYQRIAIPEGRIDDIGGELLPLEREAFQKTIADLNAKYRALYGLAKPNIVRARYTASFDNQQLVNGSAELDIKHPHSEPAYVPLSPLGLAADRFGGKAILVLRRKRGCCRPVNSVRSFHDPIR